MIKIKGSDIQQVLDATHNKQEGLPEFMQITGVESEDYMVDDDGIVWDDDGMQFISVNPDASHEDIIRILADAIIEQSL